MKLAMLLVSLLFLATTTPMIEAKKKPGKPGKPNKWCKKQWCKTLLDDPDKKCKSVCKGEKKQCKKHCKKKCTKKKCKKGGKDKA
eukprot:CAMPEP_0118813622 /NCGR_PEP_ID=MMETSP1162-20130426/3054_1 /TAXON_ID=33656 /ORGANISM="Phaeocystis Sp, Strain CCMP2710" /LENGTH=84 /DNA_ID=CAMNT_0006743437 /DNA_START=73 /DNA_END=327 /DNA_ORIENTATION=+